MKLCYIAPWRHICILTALLAVIIAFSHRVSLNIAITEMVQHDRSLLECTWEAENSRKTTVESKQKWSEITEIILLGAFYPGYIITHIPGPIICDKYGSKYPLLMSVLMSSITTALIPICTTHVHWIVVAGLRFLMGAGQGVLYPAIANLIHHWTPINDNKALSAVAYSGNWIGMTVGYVLTGTFIVISGRWDYQFYFWAITGLVYLLFASFFIYSKPHLDPYIYPEELDLLQKPSLEINHRKIYKNMFKDVAVWGLAIGQIGHTVVMTVLVTYLPKYLYMIGFDLQTITMFSCNPYAGMYLCGYFAGSTTKRSLKKHSIGCIRKGNTIVQSVFTGGLLILATYWNCEDMFTLSITTLILCFEGFYYEGLMINSLDLSFNYHRYINAMTNGIGNLGGIITSYIIAVFLKTNSMEEWRLAFMVFAGIQLVTAILFTFMGSGKRVKWDPEDETSPGAASTSHQ